MMFLRVAEISYSNSEVDSVYVHNHRVSCYCETQLLYRLVSESYDMPRMVVMEQAELTTPTFLEGNALARARLFSWYITA